MAEFETTTRTGKVIYKRRRHYFRPTDVKRIWFSYFNSLVPGFGIKKEYYEAIWETSNSMLSYIEPDYKIVKKDEIPEDQKMDLEKTLQNISIGLLEEIIEKIPFIPQKVEKVIAEYLYYNMFHFINNLIH